MQCQRPARPCGPPRHSGLWAAPPVDDTLCEDRACHQRPRPRAGVPGITKGQERGDPGAASVHRWDWEWSRCPPICQRCLEHRPAPFPNAQERAGWLCIVCAPTLASGQVQGPPRSSVSPNSLENFLPWARGREWGKGRSRGHSAVLGIPSCKDCVPSPGLKMGILVKSLGSCESLLQAGETENPKAEAPRPGWKPKETGGGGSGTNMLSPRAVNGWTERSVCWAAAVMSPATPI